VPARHFPLEHAGYRLETAGTTLLVFASVAWSLLCFLRAQGLPLTRFKWSTSAYLTGGVGILGVLIFAYGASSWYCATQRDVLVHPALFGSPRTMKWDEVRVVRAECSSTKGGRYAFLWFQFEDGTNIPFPITEDGVNRALYERIKTTMANRQYSYQAEVPFSPCPAGTAELFTQFRH